MATNLLAFRPSLTRLCAVSPPEEIRRPPSNWWSPLFGWSSDPDYIDSDGKKTVDEDSRKPGRSRFTEDKARQLRTFTNETSSFHGGMYHSAVASRLASDCNRRPDQ